MFDAAERRQQILREWLQLGALRQHRKSVLLVPFSSPLVEKVYTLTLITHFD